VCVGLSLLLSFILNWNCNSGRLVREGNSNIYFISTTNMTRALDCKLEQIKYVYFLYVISSCGTAFQKAGLSTQLKKINDLIL